jgi:prophage regulatory protein
MSNPDFEMWRRGTVEKKIGLSRGTIYNMMTAGEFPRPFKLSGNTVAWRSDEVVAWMNSRERAEPAAAA